MRAPRGGWGLGFSWRSPVGLVGIAAVSGACNALDESAWSDGTSSAPSGAAGTSTGGTSTGLGTGGVLTPPPPPPPCPVVVPDPLFRDQVFEYDKIFRRELYTWTTDEQIAELRAGEALLSRIERDDLGPGHAFTAIEWIAAAAAGSARTPVEQQLARALGGEAFAKARFAWPHPWATRMGWPGESYGNNLVRVLLREEAWLARVQQGGISVVDSSDREVPALEALATPERIAVIFFERDASSEGPSCGSFEQGANGYREYIVVNEPMIEEWSIGTPAMRDKLAADIVLLRAFLERLKASPRCAETGDPATWNLAVSCSWRQRPRPVVVSDVEGYERSLAIPSLYYQPTSPTITALIDTLVADGFEADPLVVRPGG